MKNRIYLFILFSIFFLMSEEGYARVEKNVVASDTVFNIAIRFESGQSEVDRVCTENARAIAWLDSLLTDSLDVLHLDTMTITSFVSPGRSLAINSRLVTMRMEVVKELLTERCPQFNESKIGLLHADGWIELRKLIAADWQAPNKEEMLALIDLHHDRPGKLLSLLKYLNGGKPYAYLVNHTFPKLERLEIQISGRYPIVSPTTNAVTPTFLSLPDTYSASESRRIVEAEMGLSLGEQQQEPTTVLAVKNNILYDLVLAPNLEIEVAIGRRWSLNTEYKCPWWVNGSRGFCYQLLSGGVETRCWLGNRRHRTRLTGHFVGLYAEGGIYDFQFDGGDGYQGKYYGASGVTYGYTHQIARHLALEFSLGVGYLTTEYRKYTPYKADLIWTNSGRYNFIGPTKAKVSLVWLITTRR